MNRRPICSRAGPFDLMRPLLNGGTLDERAHET
jgi:hypothetical protein